MKTPRSVKVACALLLTPALTVSLSSCSKDESNPDVRDLPNTAETTVAQSPDTEPTSSSSVQAIPTASYKPVETPQAKPKATETQVATDEPVMVAKKDMSKDPLPKDVDPNFYKLFYQSMKQEDPVPAWLSSKYILRFVRNGDGIDIYTTLNNRSQKAKVLAENMCIKANNYGLYDNIPSLVGKTVVYGGDREIAAECG